MSLSGTDLVGDSTDVNQASATAIDWSVNVTDGTYFDTSTLALRAQRMAVRERRVGRQTLLTVKTAGQSVGGLSQRGEWEAPTRPGAFGFTTLVSDPLLAEQLASAAWQLVPVFRTDFTRRSWVVQHGPARVEVALDQGFIATGNAQGTHRQPILELELELLDGPVDALLDLAHTLALGPSGQSARALRLWSSTRQPTGRCPCSYRARWRLHACRERDSANSRSLSRPAGRRSTSREPGRRSPGAGPGKHRVCCRSKPE